jgi:DNA-binding PadR family transcriptional regulator
MTSRGWIEFEWGLSDNNRRIKSYRLTTRGRKRLQSEQANWDRFAHAVARVLGEQTA